MDKDHIINKDECIKHISKETFISENKTKEILNVFFNFIAEQTANEKIISINKFGSFYVINKKYNKNQYDFTTGKLKPFKQTVPIIHFKSSKILKDFLKSNLRVNIDS